MLEVIDDEHQGVSEAIATKTRRCTVSSSSRYRSVGAALEQVIDIATADVPRALYGEDEPRLFVLLRREGPDS